MFYLLMLLALANPNWVHVSKNPQQAPVYQGTQKPQHPTKPPGDQGLRIRP